MGQIDYQYKNLMHRLRQVSRDLPAVCADYFVAIEPQTTILTRVNYAYDLRTFFGYLSSEVRAFNGKSPADFDINDFRSIQKQDIERYTSFLTLYYKNSERENGQIISTEIENGERGKMRKLSALRSFFKYLFVDGQIEGNVAELVPLPKLHQKAIIRLEIDEVARLLDLVESGEQLSSRQQKYHEQTKARDLAIMSFFLGTGIRVSECVSVNIPDFDFEQNAFVVTRKGGQEVILYFSDEVANTLKAYLQKRIQMKPLPGHEDAFFLSLQRRRITQRAVELLVKKYASIAAPLKKKISPHKLRSTFGTNLYRETGDIYLVADVLGHADVNTTRRHYAAMSEDKRRIAAQVTVLRDKNSIQPVEDSANNTNG